MSTRKTQIDQRTVLRFLQREFNNIISLNLLEGGEMSRPFSFKVNDEEFVIRIDTEMRTFEKDKYAFKHFVSDKIPIPEMIKSGKLNKRYFYAITKKVKGKTLDRLSENEVRKVLSQIIQILDAIHKISISNCLGYGDWDSRGYASFKTWKEYLLSINDQEWFKWNTLFLKSFMEKEVFDRTYEQIKKLVNYCPEERYLVHGDYGFNNVVTDGRKITGVLDWGESKYGDFLYDVAWLGFWTRDIDYEKEFYRHYQKKGSDIPYYEERLLCYKLHLGLGALHFSVMSNQEKSYKWVRDRILSFLK